MRFLSLAGGTLARTLGGAVIALAISGGAWLYHSWQTGQLQSVIANKSSEIQTLREERDQWQAAALSHKSRAEKLDALQTAAQEAVLKLQEALAVDHQAYTSSKQRIQIAPAGDDGEVAPVLRETLEGLP